MMQGERRICDRCRKEIPPGELHRRLCCRPGVGADYLGFIPSERELNTLDGTIRLDVCLGCLAAGHQQKVPVKKPA